MRILAIVRLWSVFLFCLILFSLQAATRLSFEANLGQTGTDIRYLVHTPNGVIFITNRGITLSGGGHTLPAQLHSNCLATNTTSASRRRPSQWW